MSCTSYISYISYHCHDSGASVFSVCGSGQCGRRGAEAQQVIYRRPRYLEKCRYRENTISVYSDIADISETTSRFWCHDICIFRYRLLYRDHIGHDIGEKPDIGFGNLRVCPDIDTISGPISGKNPISGPIYAISGLARNGYVPI